MDNVNCRGVETSLDSCDHNGWGRDNCGHHEDISIECTGESIGKRNRTSQSHCPFQRLQWYNWLLLYKTIISPDLCFAVVFLVRPKTIVFERISVLLWFFFFFSPRVISELRGPIAAKFCTMLLSMSNFIILVQNFEAASPKNF